MADVSLLIKILADTSSANASFSTLGDTMSRVLGIGGGGGAAGGAVLQASADLQTSMARVQTAYNSVDFTPGTAKYGEARDQIVKYSGELATSFEGVAAVYNQGTRFVDEFGSKLPIDKVNEYTDTVLRLSKVSSDAMDPTAVGQRLDVFEKLFNETKFAETGAAMAGLSRMHNLGEDPVWAGAIGIGQAGAELGIKPEEALGLANYLVDRGQGGKAGGSALGRMFLRMDTSADQILDPESKYSTFSKNRDAQEKLDDLQTSLKEADARHDQMYGQHGLKTQYRKDPAAVMAEEDRRAKLQREIADQQADIAHENDPNRSQPRGTMNMAEMAKTAGQTPEDYAALFKASPWEAMSAYTRGLSTLPKEDVAAAITKAGVGRNIQDTKVLEALAIAPDVVDRMIGVARDQRATPTELASQSATMLGTANSHLENLHNTIRGGIAEGGMPGLEAADKKTQDFLGLIQGGNWAEAGKSIGDVAGKFDGLNGVLDKVGPALEGFGMLAGMGIFKGIFGGGAGAAAGAAGAAGGAAMLGAGGLAALGVAAPGLMAVGEEFGMLNKARQSVGLPPIQINIGDVVQGHNPEQMLDEIKAQLTTAWRAAMTTTPVSGSMGGAWAVPQ